MEYTIYVRIKMNFSSEGKGRQNIFGGMKDWQKIILLRVTMIFMVCLIHSSLCSAIDFSANWKNWEFSEEEGIFTQSYSISSAPEATKAINFGASFRYINRKQGGRTQQTLTPTLSMEIVNDLFNFNLSGTQTQRKDTDRPDITNQSWNANLTSNCKGYADIQLYVGQTFDKDNADPRNINDDTLYYGLQISRRWKGLEFIYNYRGTDEDDKVELPKTKTNMNFFKASYTNTWKKLSLTAEQQFNFNRTVIKTQTSAGQPVYYPLIIGVTWNPPQPPNGQSLKVNQEMIIDLRNQPVDELRFYINEPLQEQVPSSVRWDLYESQDGVIWDELRTGITLPFRFIRTYQRNRYLKLVAVEVSIPAPELENPALMAYLIRRGTGNVETMIIKSDTARSNFSLGYQFTQDLSAHYYFSYDKSSPDPGNDTTNINHTLSASWFINRYLDPSVNFTLSTMDTQNVGEDEITTLSLNNISQVYETLQITQGYTYSLAKEKGRKSHTANTFNLTATANLYPDLDFRWEGNLTRTKNYYPSSSTTGYGSQLSLTARLTPELTLDGTHDIRRTESKNIRGGTTTDQLISMNISWSLSDDLTFRGGESLTLSSEGEDILNSTYSLWVALTPKVQANLSFMNTRGDEVTYDYSAFVSWMISQYLTFTSSYDWMQAEGETKWAWMVSLTAYF